MSASTSKSILITTGSSSAINTSVSQMDFKWYNSGVGTFFYKPNANDTRASIYNWLESGEPTLLFGGAGTSSNGVQYVVSPYIDYQDSFSGINTSPYIKFFPITGKIQTRDMSVARNLFDNSGSSGASNQFLISTATGVAWTALVPLSPVEVAANVTVSDYNYPVGDIRRYGAPNEVALLSLLKVSEQGITGSIPRGVNVVCSSWNTYTANNKITLEGGGTITGPSTTFINLRGSANIQGLAFSSWNRVLNNSRGLGYVTSLVISDCVFTNIGNNTIDLEAPFDSVLVTTSRWDNCKNYCIRLGFNSFLFQDTWQKMVISDNVFTNITATAPETSCNAMIVYGKEAVITGNIINGVTGVGDGIGECHGVYTKARQSVIDSNVIQNIKGLSATRNSGRIVGINNKGNSRGYEDAPQGFNNIISNNFIQNSDGYGIRAQCDEVLIADNIVEDVFAFAYSIDAFGDNINCTGNKAYNGVAGTSVGILLGWGTQTAASSNINISNNIVENYNEGVRVSVTGLSTVRNIKISDNILTPSASGTGVRFSFATATLENAFVTGNVITSGNHGIQMPTPNVNQVVSGMVIQDNYFTGITGNRVNGTIPSGTVLRSNDQAGRSGFGTMSPTETLHVNGTFRLSGALYTSNNNPGTSGQILSSTGAGVTWINQSSISTLDSLGIGTNAVAASKLTVLSSSTTSEFGARFFIPSSATPIFAIQNNSTITANGTFVAQNSATASSTVVARVESGVGTNFSVRADGSIIIGTAATPSSLLHIRSRSDASSASILRIENTSGTEMFRFSGTGNIRLGAGEPSGQIHVTSGFSGSAWTVNGAGLRFAAQTFTDTSTADGSTIGNNYIHAIATPTLVASNATAGLGVTYTTSATLFVASPAAGANTIVRSPLAIYNTGNTRTDGNIFVGDNANYNTVIANNLVSSASNKGIQVRTVAQNIPTVEFLVAATSTNDGDTAMDIASWVGTTTLRRVARIRANFVGSNENQASMTFSTMNAGTEADRLSITHTGLVGIGTLSPGDTLQIQTGSARIVSLTPSRVVVTDSNDSLASSAVTSTEVGYLSGASSNIQNQIDSKQGLNTNLTQFSNITLQGLIYRGTQGVSTGDIVGTANQVTVVNSDGTYALSLPQDIATNSNVQFGVATLSGLNVNSSAATIGTTNSSGRAVFVRGSDGSSNVAYVGYSGASSSTDVNLYNGSGSGGVNILTNNINRIAVVASGNVGMGITNPATRLHVVGSNPQITVGGTGLAGRLVFRRSSDGTGQGSIGYPSNSDSQELRIQSNGGSSILTLHIGGSERMRLTDSGRVGIFNSSPTQTFQVDLGANQIARFHNANSASGIWGINGGLLGQNNEFQYVGESTRPHVWYTGGTRDSMTTGTERMRLNTSGFLGIGIATPTQRLHVDGNARVSGSLFVGTNTSSAKARIVGTDVTNLLVENVRTTTTSGINNAIAATITLSPLSTSATTNRSFLFSQTIGAGVTADFTGENTGLWAENRFNGAGGTISNITAAQFNSTINTLTAPEVYNIANITALKAFTVVFNANTIATGSVITNAFAIVSGQGGGLTGSNLANLSYVNQCLLNLQNASNATNNTYLLMGQANIPVGNYAVYSSSIFPSYIRGNIGVNTVTPQATLDVNGSVLSTSAQTTSSGIGTASVAASRLTVLASSTTSEFAARFFIPSSASPIFAIQNNSTITANGTFVAQNVGTASTIVVARVESGVGTNFSVRADGSIIIGTAPTPSSLIHIRSRSDISSASILRIENTSGAEMLRFSGTGNIRLGAGEPSGQVHVTSGFSGAAWTVNGVGLRFAAQNYTDTSTADGATVNANYVHAIATPTLTASLGTAGVGVTYNTAATLFIASPTAGSNTFLRSPLALYASGNTRTDGNIFVGDNANYNTVFAGNLVSTTLHKGIQVRTSAQNIPTIEFLTAATTTADGDTAMDLASWVGTTTLRRVARIRANFVGTNENQASMTFTTMNSGTEVDRMMITHDGIVRVGTAATDAPFIVNTNGSWGFTTAVTPNTGWSASAFTTLKTLTGASTTGDIANVLCTLINVLQQHGVIRS